MLPESDRLVCQVGIRHRPRHRKMLEIYVEGISSNQGPITILLPQEEARRRVEQASANIGIA